MLSSASNIFESVDFQILIYKCVNFYFAFVCCRHTSVLPGGGHPTGPEVHPVPRQLSLQ